MTPDVCVRFGKKLRRLRLERGWTQTDLAVHTGIGRPFLSNVENGKKEPCLRLIEILAMGFEMSISQFLRGI
jgi:transcriptional regulator with XRE-family HTH domain